MRIVPSYLFVTFLMLFAVVLPYSMYSSRKGLLYDIFMHVLMIFNWDRTTYLGTQLGGSSWTIAVEMQLYLLVPLLGNLAQKKPLAVGLGMAAVSAYFRGWCLWSMTEYSMVVNQPLAFLDVYALGMACSFGYVHLKQWMQGMNQKQERMLRAAATALFFLTFWLFLRVLRVQAASPNYPAIQSGQMIRRPVLAVVLGGMLLSLTCSFRPLRLVFGNPVTRFLSTVSMNFYLLHQNIAVHLKRLGIPYSMYDQPNQAGDKVWMWQYTALAVGLSLLAAVLVTFLIEKPCAYGLKKCFAAMDRRREERHRRRTETGNR